MNNKVFVTGGAGFIGSYLVHFLLQDNYQVKVFELENCDVSHLPLDQIEVFYGDVTDYNSVVQAIHDCDYVIHLAANPNLWDKDLNIFRKVNYEGTLNVLKAAKNINIKKFIHVSTESILFSDKNKKVLKEHYKISEETQTDLNDMPGEYCRSKWQAEKAAFDYSKQGLPVIVVSPTVPIGPKDIRLGPFSRLIKDVAEDKVKGYLDGVINIIDVRDVAIGICMALTNGKIGEKYILGSENWKIKDLLDHLSIELNKPVPRFKIPYFLALSFAWLEEKFCAFFNKVPMATVTGILLAKSSTNFDATKSIKELDLKLSDNITAIKEMINWMKGKNLI